MSYCVAMLHRVMIFLLDLVTCMFYYFCITHCQYFDIEKLIKVKEKEQEVRKYLMFAIGKTCGDAIDSDRR